MAKKKVGQALKAVGPVLSRNEAKQVARQTGTSVAQVVARATNRGIGIGAALGNQVSRAVAQPYSAPAQRMGVTAARPNVQRALAPLANLQMNKGTAYYGYSTTRTPSTSSRTPNGGVSQTRGSTTYNPIVLPRNSGATARSAGGNGGQGGSGGQGGNDPYQALRDQIAAAQQQIATLQNQQPQPYPDLSQMFAAQQAQFDSYALDQQNQMAAIAAQQQAQAFAQQQSLEAQAAQQQQALEMLMIQQQDAYNQQMQMAMQQQQQQAAQAAEAKRQADALGRAYVPGLEQTAASPVLGDARYEGRSSATNTLSNLAILTGLGTSAGVTATPITPLAGLQIA